LSVWEEIEPDIVISVLPMLNGVIVDSLKDFAGGRVPTAVLITDWGEIARHTWFPKGKEYFAICGTEQSFRRLVSNGHPSTRVFRTTGLLIRPTFSHARPSHMARARRDLGLDPDCPTVCMLYGKYGGGRMITLARTLSQEPLEMQFIFLCGRDEETESALRAAVFPFARSSEVLSMTFTAISPYPTCSSASQGEGLPARLLRWAYSCYWTKDGPCLKKSHCCAGSFDSALARPFRPRSNSKGNSGRC